MLCVKGQRIYFFIHLHVCRSFQNNANYDPQLSDLKHKFFPEGYSVLSHCYLHFFHAMYIRLGIMATPIFAICSF